MCFKRKQPAAPVTTPTYAVGEAHKYAFDVSMKDEEGNVTDLDGRTRDENLRATGHKGN